MGRRLVDRRICADCGQVVETLDDGTELGHAAHAAPALQEEEPARTGAQDVEPLPAPDEPVPGPDAGTGAGADERAPLPDPE